MTTSAAMPRSIGSAAPAEPWLSTKALSHVLVLAGATCLAVALAVLAGFGGWEYYRAPLATRGYLPAHALLRPSGPVGLTLGIAGLLAMIGTIPYAIRKRWKRLSKLGTMKSWLELHIFFGVVGPVLVTFHTSFKFNGLISVAYWLMMTVWASGFVGRYLYVRIPRTIRGVELTRQQVEQRLEELRRQIGSHELAADAQRELDALARRAEHMERARRLFELWHVFHRPLVGLMFAIVSLHVGIALYLGYARLFL